MSPPTLKKEILIIHFKKVYHVRNRAVGGNQSKAGYVYFTITPRPPEAFYSSYTAATFQSLRFIIYQTTTRAFFFFVVVVVRL